MIYIIGLMTILKKIVNKLYTAKVKNLSINYED
jgi:hypothetical protein